MSDSLADFGKVFALVWISFLSGVGLGVQEPDIHVDLLLTADTQYLVLMTLKWGIAGGVVCLTIAGIIEKIVVGDQQR